jgi:hypothetical protein
MPQPTNATKATIIALVNAAFALAIAFDIVLTQAQQGAILAFVNAGLAAYVGITYKDSPKRIAE